jgi:lipoate-protein ligase A
VSASWRVLPLTVLPARQLLARAEAVLAGLRPGAAPTLGWSRVAPDALVLGRAAGSPPVDWDACAAAGVEVVRRSSGGGPVLWDGDLLALDVWVPRGHRLAPVDVVQAYRWLGAAVAEGLSDLGVPARLVSIGEARRAAPPESAADAAAAAACFGSLSPFEVVADGRKVAGLAQVRRRTGALFQAGVPLRFAAGRLAGLLDTRGAEPADVAAALERRAAGLDRFLGAVDPGRVMEAVGRRRAAVAGAGWRPGDLDPAERELAGRLAAERFVPLVKEAADSAA